MHASLQNFPTEIFQMIAENLERPELYSLRLACRDLYKKSLVPFARLFSTIKTDLSAQSLQKLEEISDLAHIAPHIHTLHFHPEEDERLLGRGFEWSRDTRGGLMDPLAGASGVLQDILKNKIINCRSFHIEYWDCYELGSYEDSLWLTPSDVVFIVYFIVVNANLQVKSLSIDGLYHCYGQLSTKRLLPLILHREQEHQEGLLTWKSLDSLVMRFRLMIDQYDWALNLLKNASGVRQLSLILDSGSPDRLAGGNYAFFGQLAALGPFHAIESLSLDCMTLNGTTLSRFLLRHKNTLRRLTLRNMQLAPDNDNEETGTSWKTVFGDMIGHTGCLEQVSVFSLFEPHGDWGWGRACVTFPSLSADDSCPVVPGSEVRMSANENSRPKADTRVIAALGSPIQLRYTYKDGPKRPYGVAYEGRKMDEFFHLLVKAKELYATHDDLEYYSPFR